VRNKGIYIKEWIHNCTLLRKHLGCNGLDRQLRFKKPIQKFIKQVGDGEVEGGKMTVKHI
jgi:hypothetical protein